MGILFGGLTSVLYGVADFLGGEGAKRASAASVVVWAGVVSFPLITAVALISGGEANSGDYLLGAGAGSAGAIGLVFLFAGLASGRAAAVAPSAGAVAGVFPVLIAVVGGERPSVVAWVGVALAIPAILLCSWVTTRGDIGWGGVGYGIVAGLGFGGYAIVINQTSEASGLLPLIPARASTMLVVLVLSLFGAWKVGPWASIPGLIVLGNGLLDVGGNVTLLLGLRSGTLALVAVASSLYPAVTVVMARYVNHESLTRRQVLGVVLSVVAIAAIALG